MSKYKDIKINLTPHPIKKDILLDVDEVAIKRSVKNILLTAPGERPGSNLKFGAGLHEYLFENVTPAHEFLISDEIKRSLKNYEPRIRVVGVNVKVSVDENYYNADIYFKIINKSETLNLNIILNRVR